MERSGIWAKLDTMQGQRCAYCEALMSETNRHIEHFRQRGRYPQGTFDWSNLLARVIEQAPVVIRRTNVESIRIRI
ncbi:TIGR02646 family protein [Pseudomonas aeruginosa]|nr:TIGR02646 family protein [Pseudomonas aeruginosa]